MAIGRGGRLRAAAGLIALTGVCAAQPPLQPSPAQQALSKVLVEQAQAFEHGEGAERDPARAASLYCQAARLGDAEALFSLGWMYANGRGVERHAGYAASLFAMAGERGLEAARNAQRFVGESSGDLPACMQEPAQVPTPLPAERGAELLDDASFEAAAADLDAYIASLPAGKHRIAELIRMLAPQYKLDPRLALAVAVTESNLEIMARSPRGALGVMQLMPETATRFGVRRIYEAGQNIRGGLSYLRWLLAYYRGDVLLAVAAYNAGEGAVDRYRGIPPFMETVTYVKRIRRIFTPPQHPYQDGLVEPSPLVVQRVAGR